jgi:arylsulfatase A-like enzyme
MIVVGPDIPKEEKREMAVYLQDIMATAIDYAGGEPPPWVEFNSLRPFIEKEDSVSYYPEVYGAYMDLQRMIRVDDYKLIVYPKAGVVRLFDLVNDPDEMHDLSKASRNRERIVDMFSKLTELQQEMGDTLNLRDIVYLHEF